MSSTEPRGLLALTRPAVLVTRLSKAMSSTACVSAVEVARSPSPRVPPTVCNMSPAALGAVLLSYAFNMC